MQARQAGDPVPRLRRPRRDAATAATPGSAVCRATSTPTSAAQSSYHQPRSPDAGLGRLGRRSGERPPAAGHRHRRRPRHLQHRRRHPVSTESRRQRRRPHADHRTHRRRQEHLARRCWRSSGSSTRRARSSSSTRTASARAATMAVGGQYYEPGNAERPVAFQPLARHRRSRGAHLGDAVRPQPLRRADAPGDARIKHRVAEALELTRDGAASTAP